MSRWRCRRLASLARLVCWRRSRRGRRGAVSASERKVALSHSKGNRPNSDCWNGEFQGEVYLYRCKGKLYSAHVWAV